MLEKSKSLQTEDRPSGSGGMGDHMEFSRVREAILGLGLELELELSCTDADVVVVVVVDVDTEVDA